MTKILDAELEIALQLIQKNDLKLAKSILRKSVSKNPLNPKVNELIAYLFGLEKSYLQACNHYKVALSSLPDDGYLHSQLGIILRSMGNFQEAAVEFSLAIKHGENDPEVYHDLIDSLIKSDDLKSAEESLEQFLNVHPRSNLAHEIAARFCRHNAHLDMALDHYDRALKLGGLRPDLWTDRASILIEMKKFDQAMFSCDQALKIDSTFYAAWYNRAIAALMRLDVKHACACFEEAVKYKSDLPEAQVNIALLSLEAFEFKKGWSKYEWRWLHPDCDSTKIQTQKPVWDGRGERGRVLVWGEQGVGDQILYCSMLPDLLAMHQDAIITVDSRIKSLIGNKYPELEFRSMSDEVSEREYDFHIPLASIGAFFRNTVEDFPGVREPWVQADSSKTLDFRRRINAGHKIICGISWSSPMSRHALGKSIDLSELGAFLSRPDIVFVDLQYLPDTAQRDAFCTNNKVKMVCFDEIDKRNDLESLAALIDACDVVVSVSNTTAHLAGAIGKPCYLLAPSLAGRFWYWHSVDGKSVWYPTITVLRKSDSSSFDHQLQAIDLGI